MTRTAIRQTLYALAAAAALVSAVASAPASAQQVQELNDISSNINQSGVQYSQPSAKPKGLATKKRPPRSTTGIMMGDIVGALRGH